MYKRNIKSKKYIYIYIYIYVYIYVYIYIYIHVYVIMKTMCPPGYHHNGFVATHALGHMMYGCHKAIVVITGRAHCFHDYIYITLILLM